MKLPRKDLFFGRPTTDKPPATKRELSVLKRLNSARMIGGVILFFMGVWVIADTSLGAIALLIVGGMSIVLSRYTADNYVPAQRDQAETLTELVNADDMPAAGIKFMQDTKALGRDLTSAEAQELIWLAGDINRKRKNKAALDSLEAAIQAKGSAKVSASTLLETQKNGQDNR